ncbi:mycofactocin-coupled SDR family oxidoreductase [Streptomyces sp. NPDC051572]|uniref:mycofactocin-coupled SDR family oxidoreductase n=1 Tax=unclassified Streptomyces TaxID=2593676 RepID=UPI003450DD4C
MPRFTDRVVLITGAARGQGRSHAIAFAQEGASIIALDHCADINGVTYPMATLDDLATTAQLVKNAGGNILTRQADVRSQDELDAAVAAGTEMFGPIDTVIANAGVFTFAPHSWELSEDEWSSTIDINLNGVWRTCKAAIPSILQSQNPGSITLVSSSNGYRAEHGHAAYNASKLGLVALMRALAGELGRHNVRVNTIHPTAVKTPMMWNDQMVDIFIPGKTTADVPEADWWEGMKDINLLPVGALEAQDISEVIMFLASEAGRYITATEIPVDAGYIMKMA